MRGIERKALPRKLARARARERERDGESGGYFGLARNRSRCRSERRAASADSLSNGASYRPIIERAATRGEARDARRELIKPDGLLLSAVAGPRIAVMYRFLIKTHPRAATSLRLSRLLAPRQAGS